MIVSTTLSKMVCILTTIRAGKWPFEISHLTVVADWRMARSVDPTEQFFREATPFGVLILPAQVRKSGT